MGEVPNSRSLTPAKSIELLDGREIRVQAALARLQMAVTLIDMAGRGLAPYVTPASVQGHSAEPSIHRLCSAVPPA